MKPDTASRNSFGPAMKNQVKQTCLRFLLGCLMLAAASTASQRCDAQTVTNVPAHSINSQTGCGHSTCSEGNCGGCQARYAPSDPTTRSRWFNFQTGHRGAYYNCDGEEDKRNSPYIRWGTGPSDAQFHNPLLDLMNCRNDKREIAQRICDGGCCGGNCKTPHPVASPAVQAPQSCGCSTCLAKSGTANSSGNHSVVKTHNSTALMERAYTGADATTKSKSDFRPGGNVAGLIATSPTYQSTQIQRQKGECDCASCRSKSVSPTVQSASNATTTKASSVKRTATTSASLLDRARSSRTRR